MNLRKRFRITTWVLSLVVFVGWVAFGITWAVEGDSEYFVGFIFAFASFAGIWLIYWILLWIVKGFHKIGKKNVLKIIKWAVIIFFASTLFHLADYVVHKGIKSVFTRKPKGTRTLVPLPSPRRRERRTR